MIRITNLSAGYGPRAVIRDVTLSLKPGEMAALLGPNGSGKTTLLSAVCGILPPMSGDVLVAGESVRALGDKARARCMAVVPQRPAVPMGLTVLSLVLMGRYPYLSFMGDYSEEDRASAAEAMAETRTIPLAGRRADRLSGGEFQRTVIARALAQQTPVLLLDEAAGALDVARKMEIHDLMREKNRQGSLVLSAVHDLNLAALYCDRLIFLKEGRVVLDGPPAETVTAETILDIYGARAVVAPHPATGAPQAHFLPGGTLDPATGAAHA